MTTLIKQYFSQIFNITVKINVIVYVFLAVLFLFDSPIKYIYPAVIALVFLHEHGHILAGKRYGIDTKLITINLLGGIAHMNSVGKNKIQKLVIAFSGPLINLILGALGAFLFFITKSETLLLFTNINIALFVFNMLPIFPMDGGRIVHALMLIFGIHITKADKYIKYISIITAIVVIFVGIMIKSILMIIIAGIMLWNLFNLKQII